MHQVGVPTKEEDEQRAREWEEAQAASYEDDED